MAADFFEVAGRVQDGEHTSALDFPRGTVIHSSMAVIHPHESKHGGWYMHALVGADPMYWVRLVGGPYESEDECIAAIRELTGLPPSKHAEADE